MDRAHADRIGALMARLPFDLDPDMEATGRPPTMAGSQFLTNREQGDWAEEILHDATNGHSPDYAAVRYGRAESLPADDPGFPKHFADYVAELNAVGKKPDLLVVSRRAGGATEPAERAVAGLEVRSSSFLADKYARFMRSRNTAAEAECLRLQAIVLGDPYGPLLREKAPETHDLLSRATRGTFREITFRARNRSSSAALRELSEHLRALRTEIRTLHKRDYLSITPKLEDLVLVNRWIQRFGVPHYYVQAFFDRAFVISFESILRIVARPEWEGEKFSVERDVKNQQKTTLKIDVGVGRELVGRIDFPSHESALRELERGRLLFYVRFRGGRGYLDADAFEQEIVGGR